MSGTRSTLRRERRCPSCQCSHLERLDTAEPCRDRFHDRLPTTKGWTP